MRRPWHRPRPPGCASSTLSIAAAGLRPPDAQKPAGPRIVVEPQAGAAGGEHLQLVNPFLSGAPAGVSAGIAVVPMAMFEFDVEQPPAAAVAPRALQDVGQRQDAAGLKGRAGAVLVM